MADDWPTGVDPIAIQDLSRLGINAADQLFWDGRQVEVRQRLVLTRVQKALAVIVTICAVLGSIGAVASGLNDGAAFLCARNLHWLSCPLPPPP